MNIAFILSIPSNNSWNGRWSGEGKIYAIVKKFSGKKGEARANALLAAHGWGYNFGDGWRAYVEAKRVEGADLRQLRKRNAGFCGYDWMVTSILEHGRILNDAQIADLREATIA